jgi:hypothetical protein
LARKSFVAIVLLSNEHVIKEYLQFRVLSAFLQHPRKPRASALTASGTFKIFQPHVSRTHCPLAEIDYQLHKSNSTFFSDLDISRVHLLLSLFRDGVAKLQTQHKGRVMPVLGGVSASFKRAIPPLAKYEVVTKVVAWDEKWVYLVSYFVKAGTMGKKSKQTVSANGSAEKSAMAASSRPASPVSKKIYAMALARYVMKAGRDTIAPQQLLEASGLVPASDSDSIENQRSKGMKFVQGFVAMEGLEEFFEENVVGTDSLRCWDL